MVVVWKSQDQIFRVPNMVFVVKVDNLTDVWHFRKLETFGRTLFAMDSPEYPPDWLLDLMLGFSSKTNENFQSLVIEKKYMFKDGN